MDRYPFTSVEDAGLGADEFEGPRRFTRPCERITSSTTGPDDVLDPRVRLRMLDRAADLLHDVVLETPQQDQYRDRLRDLAFAVKDVADDIGTEMTAPPVHPTKNVTEGLTTTQLGDDDGFNTTADR